jgi:hypothetical protein
MLSRIQRLDQMNVGGNSIRRQEPFGPIHAHGGGQSADMDNESIVDRNVAQFEPERMRSQSHFNHDLSGPPEKLDLNENIVLRNLMRNQEQRMSVSLKRANRPMRESADGRS